MQFCFKLTQKHKLGSFLPNLTSEKSLLGLLGQRPFDFEKNFLYGSFSSNGVFLMAQLIIFLNSWTLVNSATKEVSQFLVSCELETTPWR